MQLVLVRISLTEHLLWLATHQEASARYIYFGKVFDKDKQQKLIKDDIRTISNLHCGQMAYAKVKN